MTGFYSYYGFNVIKEINFDFLPELKSLRFGFNGYGPKVIDLTYNTKLIGVDVSIQRNMGSLLLPTINNISFIDVSGANKLTSAKLIVIIDKVYNAAVENNTHDGAFFLIKSLENGKEEMLRPLTPEALAKLRELRDVYGWYISPNP